KLEEFTKVYSLHPRHDDGMFYLAFAYRGDGKHPESIATLKELSQRHPRSQFAAKALENGGDWALAVAAEEEAIYFYQTYMDRFSNRPEAKRIFTELNDLYLGRELYGESSTLLKQQLRGRLQDNAEKIQLAELLLDLMEK